MLLEREPQVQQRFPQDLLLAEDERNQQSPHPVVPVEKRVDRFELQVRLRCLQVRRGALGLVVEGLLQAGHAALHSIGGGRDKGGVPWSRLTDSGLRPAIFFRIPIAAAFFGEEYPRT